MKRIFACISALILIIAALTALSSCDFITASDRTTEALQGDRSDDAADPVKNTEELLNEENAPAREDPAKPVPVLDEKEFADALREYCVSHELDENTLSWNRMLFREDRIALQPVYFTPPSPVILCERIGQIDFYRYEDEPLFLYCNGNLIPLADAVAEGMLNDEELVAFRDLCFEKHRTQFLSYRAMLLTSPDLLSDGEKEMLTTAYRAYFSSQYPKTAEEIGAIRVFSYCGKYEDAYAVSFEVEGIRFPAVLPPSLRIGELVFPNANALFYKNGTFYTLKELADASLISYEALEKYHAMLVDLNPDGFARLLAQSEAIRKGISNEKSLPARAGRPFYNRAKNS